MKKINLLNYSTVMFFVIRGCFVGMCLNSLLYYSKSSSFISALIGIIIGFFIMIFYDLLSREFPDKNIYGMLDVCFKFGIIKWLLVLFSLIFSGVIFYNFINFISTQFLFKTPNYIIAISFIIPIIYSCCKGYATFFRSSIIIFYFAFILFFISFVNLIIQSDITISYPFYSHVFSGSYCFVAYNILPLFLLLNIPRNSFTNQKNIFKYKCFTYLFACFTLFSVVYLVLTIYGINLATLLQYPEFHLLKRLSVFGFIERTENLFALQWALDYFFIMTFLMFFIGDSIKFNNFKYFIIGCLFVIIALFIFPSSTVGDNFIKFILPHLLFVFYLDIPILIYSKKKLHLV